MKNVKEAHECQEIGETQEFDDVFIYVAKTKTLISCAVTAQLICAFVFGYA